MLTLLKTDKPKVSNRSDDVADGAAPRVKCVSPEGSQGPIDWSNIVFSVAFCEKAKRDYEARMGGRVAV